MGEEYPFKRSKRLERRAIEWNLNTDLGYELVEVAIEIAKDPVNSPRDRISATKAILSMNAQNIQQDMIAPNDSESATVEISHAEYLAAMRKTVPRVADGNSQ